MSHAQKCPICNGKGHINQEGNFAYRDEQGNTAPQKTCHGCGGRGWIEVKD